MHYRSQLGREAEEKVAHNLIKDGFTNLSGITAKRHGEIDLIASKPVLLVFVEVKMRQHNYFDLSDVITPSKQRKIIAVAKEYIGDGNKNDHIALMWRSCKERKMIWN